MLGIDDFSAADVAYLSAENRTALELSYYINEMVNTRAIIAFTTHGHTGVDVNVYAYAGKKYHHALTGLRRN